MPLFVSDTTNQLFAMLKYGVLKIAYTFRSIEVGTFGHFNPKIHVPPSPTNPAL
jgi:hypothetical protein